MISWSATGRFQRHLCLALTLLNLTLGYRSAIASFVTLPSSELSTESAAMGDLSSLETRDRKPKPTRQQFPESSDRQIRAKSPRLRDLPEIASVKIALAAGAGALPPSETAPPRAILASVTPCYLQPSEIPLRGQLPPPV